MFVKTQRSKLDMNHKPSLNYIIKNGVITKNKKPSNRYFFTCIVFPKTNIGSDYFFNEEIIFRFQ